ncbi:unnamed protein product [Ectocarpus sp. CCAP 1310/34]|nr:unnamed protein product [Ectocarpus sp. CCAP 1310/34]
MLQLIRHLFGDDLSQARKLPPLELMRSILTDSAKKFAHRSTLGNGTWTPYAAATFEDERKKSAG